MRPYLHHCQQVRSAYLAGTPLEHEGGPRPRRRGCVLARDIHVLAKYATYLGIHASTNGAPSAGGLAPRDASGGLAPRDGPSLGGPGRVMDVHRGRLGARETARNVATAPSTRFAVPVDLRRPGRGDEPVRRRGSMRGGAWVFTPCAATPCPPGGPASPPRPACARTARAAPPWRRRTRRSRTS